MRGQLRRGSVLVFFVLCGVIAGVHLAGCQGGQQNAPMEAGTFSASAKTKMEPTSRVEPASTGQCVNDLERLSRITERMNRALRAPHVVTLGGAGSVLGGGPVGVDYAMFDKLSDDGVAVLVAQAIAARSKSPPKIRKPADIAKTVLERDETVGRYVARAGFGSAGFLEWLRPRRMSAAGRRQNTLPEDARVAAFMRGYSSERHSKVR